MENKTIENTENQIQDNEVIYENVVMDNNEYENTEDEEYSNEIIQENTILETDNLQTEKLEQIHQDLGIICSFLIIFALVIVFRYIYKFFDMFFKV